MQQREKKGRLLQTKDCHIGIIGSGLAGLSCALSILRSFSSSTSRDNNDELSSSTSSSTTFTRRITIYERNSNIHHYHQEQHDDDDTKQHHKGGYGMTITYNPQGPLQKLGILEKVASRDCPSRCHYIFNNHGKIYGYFGNAYNDATVDDGRCDGDVNGNEERRKNKGASSAIEYGKKEDDDSNQSCKSKRSNGKGGNNVAGQRGNLRIPRYELQSVLFNALMEEASSVAAAENGKI